MAASDPLVAAARRARRNAVAPYSHFKVGAALETADGTVVTGVNVENATYGLTVCAERVAMFTALAAGHRKFRRIAIVADTEDPTPPCGACRQILWEFGGDLAVTLANTRRVTGEHQLADLLPLPFTREAARLCASRIAEVQDFLGRRILVENVSSYLEHAASEMSEAEFVRAVAEQADCGILLDVNNLYVNARNHGLDPAAYLGILPAGRIGQVHLAGHEDYGDLVIDTHDGPVCDAVWDLYERAIGRIGGVATLIEWDARIPELSVVVAEARRAEAIRSAAEEGRHAATAA